MVCIYILKLTNNKYYVGKTNNPNFRLKSHFNKNGSMWTKKYKPIKVVQILSQCDDYDEDKYTLQYMKKYGIDNVRGGIFCQMNLSSESINIINKFINGAENKCFNCGEKGHFATECNNNNIYEDNLLLLLQNENRCYNCHRIGHTYKKCNYEKYVDNNINIEDDIEDNFYEEENVKEYNQNYEDEYEEEFIVDYSDDYDEYELIWNCSFCDKEFDSYKGAKFHENKYCKMNPSKNKTNKVKLKYTCYKCGRKGHKISECYAKTHINGYYL